MIDSTIGKASPQSDRPRAADLKIERRSLSAESEPMNDDELAVIAHKMRKVLDQAELPETMVGFPYGCCHGASMLLGTYLAECGEQGFVIIRGERGSHADNTSTSHTWLARGDLVIDITADQFRDSNASVIVERNSQWHRSFELTGSEPSDLREWGDNAPGLYPLMRDYPRLRDLVLLSDGRS